MGLCMCLVTLVNTQMSVTINLYFNYVQKIEYSNPNCNIERKTIEKNGDA